MTSCDQLNPRANVFILVNLGCEMLYVIDQRLKAQQIATEKSIQVIHDVTSVLLEPKFIDSLIVGSNQPQAALFSEEHCKFMLKDIATCSLMRLDDVSMDKLWNLMTMLYKWQLFHTKYQYQLMDITFRHFDSIAQIYPDEKCGLLIDYTKNTLLDFWNSCSDDEQHGIYVTNRMWLEKFHIKISLLIRLGFQALDGSFYENVDQTYFKEFKECIGDNIYTKSTEIAQQKKRELEGPQASAASTSCVNQLAEMLNYSTRPATNSSGVVAPDADDFKPINFRDFQKQFEKNLQQCNILFEDLDVNMAANKNSAQSDDMDGAAGFVHLNPSYNRQQLDLSAATGSAGLFPTQISNSSQQNVSSSTTTTPGINKELMELYSKLS